MNKLSIIIITKNESQNIADCINSANFADEIIVLDSKSSDDTVSISKKLGAKVFIRSWRGYGAQKNLAIKFCRGDWVLSLDADERISKSLKMEIQTVLKDPKFSAYAIQRRSYFLSKIIKFSGWRSDKVLRLFIKGKAMYSNDRVHERLLYKEKIGFLKGHIIHHSYRNLDSVLNKINLYSQLGALDLKDKKVKSSLKKALLHGLWAFIRTYFLRLGFLDGREGFILAFSQFEHTYYKYLKRVIF
jgi:glycosyltransferase involved in cell wall biosynthesis